MSRQTRMGKMSHMVDMFYYDCVLSQLIEMCNRGESDKGMASLMRIATDLSSHLASSGIVLDAEAYLKGLYIKLFRGCLAGTELSAQQADGIFEAIMVYIQGTKGATDPLYESMLNMALGCYALWSTKEDCRYKGELYKLAGTVDWKELLGRGGAHGEEPFGAVVERLRCFKFGRPLMEDFVEEKLGVVVGHRKIKRGDFFKESEGEKINW